MAILENVIQAKNADVTGIYAPELDEYPDGYVDEAGLPIALTWVTDTIMDEAGVLRTSTVQVDILVEHIGQNRFQKIKAACKTLRDLFMVEYEITPSSAFIQNDPAIRIEPGSVEFQGFRDLVEAHDGTQLHGFIFTFTAIEYLNVTC